MRVAGWIKEGKMGDYGDTGSVRFRRESGILVVLCSGKNRQKGIATGRGRGFATCRRTRLGAPERQRSRAMKPIWRGDSSRNFAAAINSVSSHFTTEDTENTEEGFIKVDEEGRPQCRSNPCMCDE